MNYFRIFTEDWTELSVNARAVYAAISCKSDFNTRKSNVCRETISKFTGIKRLDSISTATNELVEKGWIVKNTLQVEPTKKLVVYQLIDRGRNKIISTSLLDEGLDTSALALFVSLCTLRDDEGVVDYDCVYSALGFSKATYYRLMKVLKDKGLVTSDKGEVTIKKYIPTKQVTLNTINQNFIDDVTTNPSNYSKKTVREVSHLIENNFKNVNNPDAVVDTIRVGVPKHSKEDRMDNIFKMV